MEINIITKIKQKLKNIGLFFRFKAYRKWVGGEWFLAREHTHAGRFVFSKNKKTKLGIGVGFEKTEEPIRWLRSLTAGKWEIFEEENYKKA